MKIQKLFFLTMLSCFAISCSQDNLEDQSQENQSETDFIQKQLAGDFDNSFAGIYKGLFTTNDGLTRGTLVLSMYPNNQSIAQITLSTGENIKLKGSENLLVGKSANNTTKILSFNSVGAINSSFSFSVEENGLAPSIANTILDNKESDILIAKELSRAPLNTITGTYERTSGTGGFASSGRTWNIMTIGSGSQTYSTQIFFRDGIYNSIDAGSQSSCTDDGFYTTCDIDGTATVAGAAVSWSGTHYYDNFDDNYGCSEISGTWAAPSHGNSVGTFVSDQNCDGIVLVNDLCTSASPIELSETAVGDSTDSSNVDAPDFCNDNLYSTDGYGVWYVFTTPDDVDVIIDTEGSDFDTQLSVFSGSCDALTCVANDDDGGTGLLSSVAFSAAAGESYYIFVGGYQSNVGEYALTITDNSLEVYTCGDTLSDNGGVDGNYADNSLDTYVIDAGEGNTVSLDFSEFNTENTWDFVQVYDGSDNSSAEITMSVGGNTTLDYGGEEHGFTGSGENSLVGDSVVSTGQFMTIVFYSDGSGTESGFVADVVCTAGRAAIGQSRSSLTFTPPVSAPRVAKQTLVVEQRRGQMKTEAYLNSQR